MTKEELEVNIAALELLVNEAADKSTDFKAQLAQAKQELADINKPELTPSQMDDIYEAVERGVSNFDFSDSDNYDKDFGIDYDGRVTLESLELTSSTELVEGIVEKISRLFVETIDDEEGNKGPGNE